jgi:hypothetical protein
MISFEHRVLSEYRIKIAKIETLVKSIMTHRDPKFMKNIVKFFQIMANDLMLDHVYQKIKSGMKMLKNIMKKILVEDLENNLNFLVQ